MWEGRPLRMCIADASILNGLAASNSQLKRLQLRARLLCPVRFQRRPERERQRGQTCVTGGWVGDERRRGERFEVWKVAGGVQAARGLWGQGGTC